MLAKISLRKNNAFRFLQQVVPGRLPVTLRIGA